MHALHAEQDRDIVARPRAASPGGRSHVTDVLRLQRLAGNRAVATLIQGRSTAPRVTIQRDDVPAQGPASTMDDAEDIYDDLGGGTSTATDAGGTAVTGTDGGRPSAVPAGAPGLLDDKDEAAYRARGDATLGELGGPVAGTVTTGHTPSGPIAGFPDWFANLQNRLIASAEWRADKEEPGQLLLEEYALKRFAVPYGGDASKVPPTIRVYAHYIGRSTSNQRAAAKAGLPHTGQIGGPEGAKMWCAAAGTRSLELALASLGLRLKGGPAWTYHPPVPMIGYPTAAVDGAIEPGDQVSYIGGGAPAIGGHTTSVVSPSQGDGSVFLHASGNAGGGTSGSVRLTSSKPRARPPASVTFADISTKKPDSIGAPADRVWVYAIVKYSRMWADLATIDTTAADAWTSGPGAEFVNKYRLEVLPVST